MQMLNEIKRILDLKPKEKKEGVVEKVSTIQKQRKRINALEIELETLKSNLKDELYKKFMEKFDEPLVIQRLKKENRKLKEKIEVLKNELSKKQ